VDVEEELWLETEASLETVTLDAEETTELDATEDELLFFPEFDPPQAVNKPIITSEKRMLCFMMLPIF